MIRIDEILKDKTKIGIGGHIHPDGDCIGSSMGLYLYLRKTYPEKECFVFLEKIPEEYHFIEGIEDIIHDGVSPVGDLDLFIVLDCAKDRLGDAEHLFDNAKETLNIDHHKSNPGTGDHCYIVPTASSTCELVCDVIGTKGLPESSAIALYMGMVTDTGVFKYSNTSEKTMRIAGELISYGFDFPALIDRVFFEHTYIQNRILGKALSQCRMVPESGVVVSCITKEDLTEYGAEPSDLDGIVSQMNLTKEAECAVFLYELPSGKCKVSLRSKGAVDVAKVASAFGGGGHERAAGATVTGNCDEILQNVLNAIAKERS